MSAGFDIGAGDPLGGMEVSRSGFGAMAESIRRMAESTCRGRVAGVLEGGYNLVTLREGVQATLSALAAKSLPASPPAPAISEATRRELAPCFELFGKHWNL